MLKPHLDPTDALQLRLQAAEVATERVKRRLARALAELEDARTEAGEMRERAERAERALAMATTAPSRTDAARALSRAAWGGEERPRRLQAQADALARAWRLVHEEGCSQTAAAAELGLPRSTLTLFLSRRVVTEAGKLAWAMLEAETGTRQPRRAARTTLRGK